MSKIKWQKIKTKDLVIGGTYAILPDGTETGIFMGFKKFGGNIWPAFKFPKGNNYGYLESSMYPGLVGFKSDPDEYDFYKIIS